jgi:Zn-dependent protease with chaperone function
MKHISASRVAAVEKLASESPRWFRFKVGLIAVCAEVLFQIALITPLIFIFGIGLLFFPYPLFIGCALIGLLSMWWAIQPSFYINAEKVNRNEAPSLYAMLDEVVLKADALEIHEIRINSDFNAGALELGRGWIPGKIRRILILGGPLIASLSQASLKAVIAHEIGHFSKQHGKLGHWVYRARLGWASNASRTDKQNSILDNGLVTFASKFLQWFDSYAFVYSRHCEYEADAIAAKIVGASNFAAALAEVELTGRRYHNDSVTGQDELNRTYSEMPENIWRIKALSIKTSPFLETDLAQIWEAPPKLNDTHPPLSHRSEALSCDIHVVRSHMTNEIFKQTGRCEDIGFENAASAHKAQNALDWQLDHARLMSLELIGWKPEDSNAERILFSEACELLDKEDKAAIARLKNLIKTNPSWTTPVREKFASLPQQWLEHEERESNLRLLGIAYERRISATDLWFKDFYENKQKFSIVQPEVIQVLAACIQVHPHIERAGIAQSTALLDNGKRSYPLVLCWIKVNAKTLHEKDLSDDFVAEQIARQIEKIVGGNVLSVVIPSFSTESEPSWVSQLTRIDLEKQI